MRILGGVLTHHIHVSRSPGGHGNKNLARWLAPAQALRPNDRDDACALRGGKPPHHFAIVDSPSSDERWR